MGIMEKGPFLEEVDDNKKFCADCKTTKTPLWRGGPSGPKSLCNACGIRYRKRRTFMVGTSRGSEDERERTLLHGTCSSSQETVSKCDGNKSENQSNEPSKVGPVGFGREGVWRKSPSMVKKQRCQRKRKLGEEERAAVSLMALSCASVFA